MNPFPAEMRRDPYPAYESMRAASPVHHLAGPDVWMVLDHADVKRTLTDHEAFSSNVSPTRGHGFEWLLFLDPPRHTKLRAIVAKAFTPSTVADLEPQVRAISRELLDAAAPRGEMDLAADYAVPLPMRVIAAMVGLDGDDWPRLKMWSDALMGLADTIAGTPEEALVASEAFGAADDEMREYFEKKAADRRRDPRGDLLTRLVEAEVDGARLTAEELLRFVQLLLAAGTETTTNLIDSAALCLMEHPDELAKLRAQPDLVPRAIEEVLRFRSPGQAMFRATARDVEIGGKTIPKGKMVLAMIGAANRDSKAFVEPARFDVTRDPNPHLAFGHGIHFCLGAPLSRLEGRVALGDLLGRFRHFERATDAPWEPRKAFHVHGPTSLPIRFELARP